MFKITRLSPLRQTVFSVLLMFLCGWYNAAIASPVVPPWDKDQNQNQPRHLRCSNCPRPFFVPPFAGGMEDTVSNESESSVASNNDSPTPQENLEQTEPPIPTTPSYFEGEESEQEPVESATQPQFSPVSENVKHPYEELSSRRVPYYQDNPPVEPIRLELVSFCVSIISLLLGFLTYMQNKTRRLGPIEMEALRMIRDSI